MQKGFWYMTWQNGRNMCQYKRREGFGMCHSKEALIFVHAKGPWYLSVLKSFNICPFQRALIYVSAKGLWYVQWQKDRDIYLCKGSWYLYPHYVSHSLFVHNYFIFRSISHFSFSNITSLDPSHILVSPIIKYMSHYFHFCFLLTPCFNTTFFTLLV